MPGFDPKQYERPGAARQRARAAWDSAIKARQRYDERPLDLHAAADLAVAEERYRGAAAAARLEVEDGMAGDEASGVIASWEADDDMAGAPRSELRQHVDDLLSQPHLLEQEGHQDGS